MEGYDWSVQNPHVSHAPFQGAAGMQCHALQRKRIFGKAHKSLRSMGLILVMHLISDSFCSGRIDDDPDLAEPSMNPVGFG